MGTVKGNATAGKLFAALLAAAMAFALSAFGAQSAYADSDSLTIGKTQTVVTGPDGGKKGSNCRGYANHRTLYLFGTVDGTWYNDNTMTWYDYDVTGDGIADTVKIVPTKSKTNSGLVKKIRIDINGETVKTFGNSYKGMDRIVVKLFTLSNNKPFLYIDSMSYDGSPKQIFYQYKNYGLKKLFAHVVLAKRNTSNARISSIKLMYGTKMKITWTLSTTVTGLTKVDLMYRYKDGTLKRAHNFSTAIRYATGERGGFYRSKVTAAGSFKTYTYPYSNKKAFTVKAGEKVQPLAIRLKNSRIWYKVQNASGKKGWFQCPKIKRATKSSSRTVFRETYGKVTLTPKARDYSSDTYLSTAYLEKLTDHALFMARNEIYARHGKMFTNRELAQYFMSRKWYRPRRVTTPLTDADAYNAALILDIEQKRTSPYAV